ncbi:hypothetical protein [Streptomyces sp. NPDC006285]|uniref:hypothetical protein n=1 Tax=Streptomyces sp. NPDC006285 TaxID=3364742 RepID=UPI0036B6416E
MTTCDEGGPSVVFALVPGASWLDDESDCRWCSILLGPGSVAAPAPADRVRGRRAEQHARTVRAWMERTRRAILLVSALTVLAALALVASG